MAGEDHFTGNDRALLDEAVRRVEKTRVSRAADRTSIVAAVSNAMLGGRRDMFGLVKAGQRAR